MRLIDADALINVLKDPPVHASLCGMTMADVLSLVDEAPTINAVPVTSWVADRHPPFGENVLITFATGEIGIGDYRDFVNSPWYADGQYFGDEDIVAWMPLPEPWKEESNATD